MKLNILISTINDGIKNIEKIFLPLDNNISYIISHQITNNKDYLNDVTKIKQRKDTIYLSLDVKGLSKNRNNCLKHIDGDIVYICDDDVCLRYEGILEVISKFKNSDNLDVLRCQVKTLEGKPYKQYKPIEYKIASLRELTNSSSIEMTVKSSFIKDKELLFDEDFGIGTVYPIGEDFIFITDVFKKNGNIVHYPIDIVEHEEFGTGGILADNVIFGRGAMFARVFGKLSFIINIYFAIKNRKKYKSKYTFWEYNTLLFQGNRDYVRKIS